MGRRETSRFWSVLSAHQASTLSGLEYFYVGNNRVTRTDQSGLVYVALRAELSNIFFVIHSEDNPKGPLSKLEYIGLFTIDKAPCNFIFFLATWIGK
jgi:hypothetical protein